MAKSILPFNIKGRCYICQAHCNTQEHHIFQGSNRQAADKYGLLAELCPECHRRVHRYPKEFEETYLLKQHAQIAAMSHYHWDIDTWRELFRKDYRE